MTGAKKLLMAAAGNAGSDPLYVEDVFSTYLYEGTGEAKTITNGIDLSGEGGMVWVKGREETGSHILAREPNRTLNSDLTAAEDTYDGYVNGYNSDGFDLGTSSNVNSSGKDMVSWTFRKAEKFFDIVEYSGNSVNGRQLPHNLGSTPGMVVCKRTDTGQNWILQHRSLDLSSNKTMYLNTTAALAVANDYWNSTHASDTVITLSGHDDINGTNGTYVAYVFAHNAGGFGADEDENIISCGSVTTDGSGNASVDVGFEPQWCLWKCVDAAGGNEHGNWRINDTVRGWPVPDASNAFGYPSTLYANISNAEAVSGVDGFIKSATGFGFGQVQANKTYIYIAIRRPMKTPEAGTEVYKGVTRTGNASNFSVDSFGFTGDFLLSSIRTPAGYGSYAFSRLTGGQYLRPYGTNAEASGATSLSSWDMEGFSGLSNGGLTNDNTVTYVYNLFKRATGCMDVVAWAGTGVAGRTVAHNLGVVPSMMVVKCRNFARNWCTYHISLGNGYQIILNSTAAKESTALWNSTTPSATVFTLNNDGDVNGSPSSNFGNSYIAYLFATLDGVSKVGSYTGTGSNVDVDCGFSAGARFILIKRSDSAGDWYLWDSFRGIIAGNDPYLLLNSTAAEVTNTDYIDPLSSGFTVTSSAPAGLNTNSGTYIFLAIA